MPNDTQDWSQKVDVDTTLSGALSVDLGSSGAVKINGLSYMATQMHIKTRSGLAAGGTNWGQTGYVPTGAAWLIQSMCGVNFTNICTKIYIYLETYTVPVVPITIAAIGSPPIGTGCIYHGNMILKSKERIVCRWDGCVGNDSIAFDISAYVLTI